MSFIHSDQTRMNNNKQFSPQCQAVSQLSAFAHTVPSAWNIHIHYSGYSGKPATFPKWVLGSSSLSCITWYLSPFIGTICSQVLISIKPRAGKTGPPSYLSFQLLQQGQHATHSRPSTDAYSKQGSQKK